MHAPENNICAGSHDIGIRFLDLFQDNKLLGKDSLKFAKTFSMSVEHNDVTTMGTQEDFFLVGKILEYYGQTLRDFTSIEDALTAVRHLCVKNREEHQYDEKPEYVDDKFPAFSKFFFVMSKGKHQEHKQVVHKKLEQTVDLKNIAQLDEAKIFMEGIGFNSVASDAPPKVENAKAIELKKNVELLKFSHLAALF